MTKHIYLKHFIYDSFRLYSKALRREYKVLVLYLRIKQILHVIQNINLTSPN